MKGARPRFQSTAEHVNRTAYDVVTDRVLALLDRGTVVTDLAGRDFDRLRPRSVVTSDPIGTQDATIASRDGVTPLPCWTSRV